MPPQLRAVLFDFDGLIADTEPLHYEGFRQAVAPLGIDLDKATYYDHYVGFDDRDGFDAILSDYDKSLADHAKLMGDKARIVESLFREQLTPKPYVLDFIHALYDTGDVAMGICSGALRAEVLLATDALGVADCFSHVVAADDVAHSKPDPEGYMKLIDLLVADAADLGRSGFQPNQCVVLEDTVKGLQSGKAAGCYTVGVLGTETEADLAAVADTVVPHLGQLDLRALAL